MKTKNMQNCKTCGTQISKGQKIICPQCGKVNKPPLYKRTWFIVLAVIFGLSFIGSLGSDDTVETSVIETSVVETSVNDNSSVAVKKEPIVVTVTELNKILETNALKASQTFKDQYVQLTGTLGEIDSSGNYFYIGEYEPMFDYVSLDVKCNIDEEHIDQLVNYNAKDNITVVGTITYVGEFMGYTLEVESIKNTDGTTTESTTEDNNTTTAEQDQQP